ncbi:hypothetical protein DESAMIL20_1739 [Desulfurella amilsii]|uniref:Uncharacterized protein n=1 Tax=Desulfurella amilsii TaxID=1562698 RepID=A0A1X4XXC5_9BACT|nr:hypothetical protein [Desulfurella amilsii]OSS42186.1 hypothetical protein DESAMIL20_1739 [Desulfurella amilsii]
MKRVFELLVLFVFLNIPIFTYAGAWEQAQELCKQSGGNCNYNIPTPTPSIDRNYSNKPQPSAPKTYKKSRSPSLSPSESMTIGIFGSLLGGLFSGLMNPPDTTNDDYLQAQKQKEYEEQQKLLMQKKQQALKTWHAIKDQSQSETQATQQNQDQSLGFKTLGSSIVPFKWQDKINTKELSSSVALMQSQNQFDLNHEVQNFFGNRLSDLVQEGGKVFLEKYHKSNILLAETLKEQKKIKGLSKFIGDNVYENTLGIASIIVDYKIDGVAKALQSIADFSILKIGIPQASFTLEVSKVYSRFVFNLLGKDLTEISNAVGMDFDFKEFINNNFNAYQKGVYEWYAKE